MFALPAAEDNPGREKPPVAADIATLYDEIGALLDAPSGDASPPIDVIERTLTDGYAQALTLEAEQHRIERQIAAIVGEISDSPMAADRMPLITSWIEASLSRYPHAPATIASITSASWSEIV